MSKAKSGMPNAASWLGDLSALQESHDAKPIPISADLKLSDLLYETLAEAPVEKLEAAPDVPAPAPIKTVSDFEAGMLKAARDLYLDEDLRREVAKRIS